MQTKHIFSFEEAVNLLHFNCEGFIFENKAGGVFRVLAQQSTNTVLIQPVEEELEKPE